MPILSNEERENVRIYKYHGGDSSPIYQYVLSPIAQFFVDYFTPRWMAPNLITLLGLFVSIMAAVLTIMFNPNLTMNGPRWLHFVTGLSIFAYQTLDNMDGKQARRTGSSSALGMLFDHGCDAINAGVTALSMASVLGTGWTGKFFFSMICAYIPFYFQTWEEYYLGAMILPPFNGPTEGLLMTICVCFLAGFNGSEWFESAPIVLPSYLLPPDWSVLQSLHIPTRSHPPEITPVSIAMLVCFGATFITAIVQTLKVLWILSSQKKSVAQPLLDLLPFVVFFPSIIVWCSHSRVAFPKYPLVTVLFINAVFVEMAVHLMLMHICKGAVKPLERYGAYVTFLFPVYVALKPAGVSDIYETWALFAAAGYFTVLTTTTIYRVCTEVAQTLNINVLSLGKWHSK